MQFITSACATMLLTVATIATPTQQPPAAPAQQPAPAPSQQKPPAAPAAPATPAPGGNRGQAPRSAVGGGTAPLTVDVTDRSGNGIANVQVSVAGPVDRSGTTGADGSVAFRGMRAGTYRLRFEVENFVTLERELAIRGGAASNVSVALTAAPAKPAPKVVEPVPVAPPPPPPSARNVEPRTLSIPDFLDKNLIGGEPQRRTLLGCAEGGTATLVQVRDPLNDQQHADNDEIIYVVAGSGVIRMRNQDTPLRPGHFALVPRGLSHSLRRDGRNPLITLSVLAGSPCTEQGQPTR